MFWGWSPGPEKNHGQIRLECPSWYLKPFQGQQATNFLSGMSSRYPNMYKWVNWPQVCLKKYDLHHQNGTLTSENDGKWMNMVISDHFVDYPFFETNPCGNPGIPVEWAQEAGCHVGGFCSNSSDPRNSGLASYHIRIFCLLRYIQNCGRCAKKKRFYHVGQPPGSIPQSVLTPSELSILLIVPDAESPAVIVFLQTGFLYHFLQLIDD